jgi:hypothetical protein
VGIPDHLRTAQGRWRSEIVAGGYIDESINIQMQLRACQHAARNHAERQQHEQIEKIKEPKNQKSDNRDRRQSQRKTKQTERLNL